MSGRVARRGAHRTGSYDAACRRGALLRPFSAALFFLLVLPLLAACGGEKLKHVDESWEVVGGEPSLDPTRPTVDERTGTARATDFASSSPVQVDAFTQSQVGKVDILWVIDDSSSMTSKQNKVKQNFQAFIQKLVESNAAIDYHIGVVTTDVYNPAESGKLQNHAGLSRPWIGTDTCTGGCDPVAAFRANANVGTSGSGDEKPLLAAEMALSAPLATTGANAGFLRDDAAFFLIILSDEEDSSCAPLRADTEGCDSPEQWGSPDYFVRFFKGLKGYGRSGEVTVGAIVATTQDATFNQAGQTVTGCKAADDPSQIAIYAPRTVAVAEKSGGLATSICDANYLPALQNLGFLATGARTTFFLTRAPYPEDLKVYVTKPGGSRTLQVAGTDYDYEPCGTGGAVKNAIEFHLGSLPPAGATVEAEYPVNVRGVQGCH